MGEKQNGPFQLSFNASLKVDLQGSRVASDGGLILVREPDERFGFGDLIAQHLSDSRCGKNFAIFAFSAKATNPPCGGEDGSRRKNAIRGTKG
jgi:hypothetical protein